MRPGQILFLLLPVVLIVVLFNSQRRRQRQAQQTQAGIEPGTKICTTAGLFGTVVAIEGDVVVIEAAPGVNLRFDRRAISLVVPSEDPAAPDEHLAPEDQPPPDTA